MSAQSYEPFRRGRFPVGVRTIEVSARADRRLPVELWYPATDDARGRDVDAAHRDTYNMFPGAPTAWQLAVRDAAPRKGNFPAVVFSHGFGGHRRQSTFLCTHLASHGYFVAAPDHRGNTAFELMQQAMTGKMDRAAAFRDTIEDRPGDITAVIDTLLADYDVVDRNRVAMVGHSFGGWTALRVVAAETRIGVVVPLSPAAGFPALRSLIDFEWARLVPTLVISGDRDAIVPIDGVRAVFQDLRAPKKLVVIERADHMHFCDQAEQVHEFVRNMPMRFVDLVGEMAPFKELLPAEPAADVVRGLTLGHLDAFLAEDRDAKAFLATDLAATCASRGATIQVS
jgi:predicted dienelactone hydrolase